MRLDLPTVILGGGGNSLFRAAATERARTDPKKCLDLITAEVYTSVMGRAASELSCRAVATGWRRSHEYVPRRC